MPTYDKLKREYGNIYTEAMRDVEQRIKKQLVPFSQEIGRLSDEVEQLKRRLQEERK